MSKPKGPRQFTRHERFLKQAISDAHAWRGGSTPEDWAAFDAARKEHGRLLAELLALARQHERERVRRRSAR